jgi:Xaa-Pro aminopeptidase
MNDAGFQAVIVTSDDAHQSEYVSDSDARRSFISGFDGSAGTGGLFSLLMPL